MRTALLLCVTLACGHTQSKDTVTPEIQHQLAELDTGPDKLHLDRTPAVSRLVELGEPALVPLYDHLDDPDMLHRKRAQRAVEGITRRSFGFNGDAWPDGALERWSAWWIAIGYDADAEPAARGAAIARLRAWSKSRTP
jgi:hypothetical protein